MSYMQNTEHRVCVRGCDIACACDNRYLINTHTIPHKVSGRVVYHCSIYHLVHLSNQFVAIPN